LEEKEPSGDCFLKYIAAFLFFYNLPIFLKNPNTQSLGMSSNRGMKNIIFLFQPGTRVSAKAPGDLG